MPDDKPLDDQEPDERLMSLASQVDEGREVDWDAAERDAKNEDERAIVSELRLLADVARVCRDPDSIASLASDEGLAPDRDAASTVPKRWGPLTILEPIGRGAFATVYRARDNLNREVALKLFSLPRDTRADRAARMRREGELLARVKHTNVVTIYGADEFDGIVGLWMELIDGRTLEAELATRGTFSPQEALPLGRELCRALAAVQSAGLLHRDVKAHNVMRETGGRIVLMDFGTGKEAGPGTPAARLGGDLAGTPLYLAPELFAGAAATPASDIYSLGVLLFHLVTGRYPVEGADRAEIQAAHAHHRRTRLRDARPDLPDGVIQVIERAIAPEAAQRYQTAGAFDEALAGALGTSGGTARANASEPTGQKWWMGAGGWSLATLGAVAVAVLASMLIMRQGTSTPGGAAITPTSTAQASAPVESLDSSFLVKANFFRRRGASDTILAFGDQVRPGDTLGLRIQASKPVFVYVINKDERGEAFLLFPKKDGELTNPLPADRLHELPGQKAGLESLWLVTSPGEREHFLVFASAVALSELESAFRALPEAEAGRPVVTSLTQSLIGRVRGVGGIAQSRPRAGVDPWTDFLATTPRLGGDTERATGPWIRQISLENPLK